MIDIPCPKCGVVLRPKDNMKCKNKKCDGYGKNKFCYAAGCHRPLPKGKRKYCSDRCYNRISMQKKRAKKKGIEWSQEDDVLEIPSKKNVQSRRGKVYTDIKESGLAEEILKGKTLYQM